MNLVCLSEGLTLFVTGGALYIIKMTSRNNDDEILIIPYFSYFYRSYYYFITGLKGFCPIVKYLWLLIPVDGVLGFNLL